MATQILAFLAVGTLVGLHVSAQLPSVCVPVNSARECCPDNCGGPEKGQCVDVDIMNNGICNVRYSSAELGQEDYGDERFNWPKGFFLKLCKCKGNYDGFDCGECKFGYDKQNNCQTESSITRASVRQMSATDWKKYNMQLNRAKTTYTRYSVYTGGDIHSSSSYSPVTLYNLAVSMHHYAARTRQRSYSSDGSAYDYAHGSSAFLTWHRLYLLWFEREIRIITDDPKFKLSYWNWLDPDDRDILYSEDKLGSRNNNGYVISDTYGGSNWQPVCLYPESNPMFTSICNPTNPSAYKDNTNDYTRLQRPLDKNYNWPAKPETAEAIQNLNEYRLSAAGSVFNKYNRQSFSNYLEGWDPQTSCGQQMFCGDDNIPRRLHNLIHLLIGGTMANVAGSPNDPMFFNHHTMIDCLFQLWLEEHTNQHYPSQQVSAKFAGHGPNDCLVPFIPPYTNKYMYDNSIAFGYRCSLTWKDIFEPSSSSPSPTPTPSSQSSNGVLHNKVEYVVFFMSAIAVCIALYV